MIDLTIQLADCYTGVNLPETSTPLQKKYSYTGMLKYVSRALSIRLVTPWDFSGVSPGKR